MPTTAEVIASFAAASGPDEASRFAQAVVERAAPSGPARAKVLLFAAARLAAFAINVGLEAKAEVIFHRSVIERFIACGTEDFSGATRRTLRSNLRFIAGRVLPASSETAMPLPRERAKAPYSQAEIAAYLALSRAQPTLARRMRCVGLICLGAGAGLMGTDLRHVRGDDVVERSGGVLVCVGGKGSGGPRPRRLPRAVDRVVSLRRTQLCDRRGEPVETKRDHAAYLFDIRRDRPGPLGHRAASLDMVEGRCKEHRSSHLHGRGRHQLLPAARRHRGGDHTRRRGRGRGAARSTLSARTRLSALEAVLDDSGAAEMLCEHMPFGGRPRQLRPRTVMLGIALALSDGRPAHLTQAHKALTSLPIADQLRLGVAVHGPAGLHVATYRQFSDAHQVMTRSIDPSPVPSFRGILEHERAAHLAKKRSGVDVEQCRELLCSVTDALTEASVADEYKHASSSLAVDWKDHETWSRPKDKDDTQPSNDPDASWGHAKRNAPGAKDALFYGYYAQVATMVRDEGGPRVPELVRRIAFAAPRLDPAAVMALTLLRTTASSISLGDVLSDCGYSHRDPQTWAGPLRGQGARLVFDLHPNDRGPKGTFEGAVLANGQLYCPATPIALLGLAPLSWGASASEMEAHDARCAEAGRYRLGTLGSDDEDGFHRVMCPASAGKLRCPLKPTSMALSAEHPSVLRPPPNAPRCCRQQTITVPPQVNESTRQKHPYPSTAHRDSYARRTAAERAYASLADPSAGGIRRGWSRLFGLAKNTLMYALGVVVRNLRITESYERARDEDARRAAAGLLARRTRRRRHQREEQQPSAPAPKDAPRVPG